MAVESRPRGFLKTVSIRRAAVALGVSESTIRRLLHAGAFPQAYRIGKNLVRIPIADLQAFRQAHAVR